MGRMSDCVNLLHNESLQSMVRFSMLSLIAMDLYQLIDSKITRENDGGSDQKKLWDNFWNRVVIQKILDTARIYETNFYINHVLKKYLDSNATFCELGCGTAILLRSVAPFYKKVIALDYSEPSLRISKKVLDSAGIRNYELVKQDIRDFTSIKPIYDVVFSNGLVEHFKEPHVAIEAHIKYLKRGGVAVILVPSKYSIKWLWFNITDNRLLKKFWWWTEQRFFTNESMDIEMQKIKDKQINWYKVSTLHSVENILLVIKKS